MVLSASVRLYSHVLGLRRWTAGRLLLLLLDELRLLESLVSGRRCTLEWGARSQG